MEQRHTPLPWHYVLTDRAAGNCIFSETKRKIKTTKRTVANIPFEQNSTISDYNAQFIVHAVNNHYKLVSALKVAKKGLESGIRYIELDAKGGLLGIRHGLGNLEPDTLPPMRKALMEVNEALREAGVE